MPLISRWKARLSSLYPPGQFGRYLLVGVCNTLFGYAVYAVLTALFTGHLALGYVLASLLAGFFNFTFSYLNYKFFIFKTPGNYLREWLRCVAVYSGGLIVVTILLPPTVFAIRRLTPIDRGAPYVAGALLTLVNVLAGFLGHKHFSFVSTSATDGQTKTAG